MFMAYPRDTVCEFVHYCQEFVVVFGGGIYYSTSNLNAVI